MSEQHDTDIRHPGGDWVKIRLTALEQDVLWHFINQFHEEEDSAIRPVLDDILDKLPEYDITSRPPSVETLIEAGYYDRGITTRTLDAPTIVGEDD